MAIIPSNHRSYPGTTNNSLNDKSYPGMTNHTMESQIIPHMTDHTLEWRIIPWNDKSYPGMTDHKGQQTGRQRWGTGQSGRSIPTTTANVLSQHPRQPANEARSCHPTANHWRQWRGRPAHQTQPQVQRMESKQSMHWQAKPATKYWYTYKYW